MSPSDPVYRKPKIISNHLVEHQHAVTIHLWSREDNQRGGCVCVLTCHTLSDYHHALELQTRACVIVLVPLIGTADSAACIPCGLLL